MSFYLIFKNLPSNFNTAVNSDNIKNFLIPALSNNNKLKNVSSTIGLTSGSLSNNKFNEKYNGLEILPGSNEFRQKSIKNVN